jgi:hypothetical protein
MSAEPIHRNEFTAEMRRLDQANNYTLMLLNNHIADYRREAAEVKANVSSIDGKVDQVLANQDRIKGRDGVILVIITAFVSICTAVITASILGVL